MRLKNKTIGDTCAIYTKSFPSLHLTIRNLWIYLLASAQILKLKRKYTREPAECILWFRNGIRNRFAGRNREVLFGEQIPARGFRRKKRCSNERKMDFGKTRRFHGVSKIANDAYCFSGDDAGD